MLSVDNDQLKVNAPKDVLQREQVNFIKENKPQIIEILTGLALQNHKLAMFSQPVVDGTIISKGQRQMWLLDQVTSGQPYCFFRILRLDGRLNIQALNEAFNVLIHRHKQLRTTYHEHNGGVITNCLEQYKFKLESSTLTPHSGGDDLADLDSLIAKFQNHEFDLSADVMLKAEVASRGESEHFLLIKCHHIATDGWSLECINRELNVIYSALEAGEAYTLPELQHEYEHFSQFQAHYLNHAVANADRAFWSTYLNDVSESLNLSCAAKVDNDALIAETVDVVVDKQLVTQLKKVCNKHNMTMYTLFQFAFTVLLSRYSQQQDVVLGTPVANRDDAQLQSIVGYFVNTLPIRFNVDETESFSESVKRYQDVLNTVMEHKELPLNDIVNAASISAELLTQIMFTYSAFESSVTTLGSMNIDILEPAHKKTDIELHLNCIENNSEVVCQWHYANTLFDKRFIDGMGAHFITMLHGLVALELQDAPLSEIGLLSEQEVEHLIYDLNDTVKAYPKEMCIQQLFESQVAASPDQTALVFDDHSLTYRQLNEKANQLAHYLIAHHDVQPDTPIGLCVERSLEMVIGILAILKAGGAYVPLDPSYPEERLGYMCQDTGLQLVLTQSQVSRVLSDFSGVSLLLDNLASSEESIYHSYSTQNIDLSTLSLNSRNLAYVIYTSGSTGKPKGVMVEHQAVTAFLSSPIYADKALSGKVASLSSYAFDGFVYDLFYSLTSASELHIYPQDLVLDVERFKQAIQQDEIENFFTTTALFNVLAEHKVLSDTKVKQVLFGGERSDPRLVEKFKAHHPSISLMHVYGPTEAIVYATACNLEGHHGITPIGRPLNHNALLILNEHSELVPFGCVGDLHIGGDSLARGYLNREELTRERFIDNPYFDASHASSVKRLYRTGDLVRYLPDGNIEFVGRADDQVKIRGFRIELGEIEAQLTTSELIDSAFVMAHKVAGSAQLIGYVKSKEHLDNAGQQALAMDLKTTLSAKLPDYMVPSAIIVVSEWPLTPNGKIDKKALPSPDSHLSVSVYQAPENDVEQSLVDIIADELQLDALKVSVTSGFYELGGHSLLALKIQSKLKEVGYFVNISDVLLPISLQDLANKVRRYDAQTDNFVPPKNMIDSSANTITVEQLNMVDFTPLQLTKLVNKVPGGVSNISDIYSLSPLQEGMLFHHIMDKDEDLYLSSFTLQLDNKAVLERFFDAMRLLINRHDTLRTIFFWEDLPESAQVVLNECELDIEYFTLDDYSSVEMGRAQLEGHRAARIDLQEGPLLKLKVGKNEGKSE